MSITFHHYEAILLESQVAVSDPVKGNMAIWKMTLKFRRIRVPIFMGSPPNLSSSQGKKIPIKLLRRAEVIEILTIFVVRGENKRREEWKIIFIIEYKKVNQDNIIV